MVRGLVPSWCSCTTLTQDRSLYHMIFILHQCNFGLHHHPTAHPTDSAQTTAAAPAASRMPFGCPYVCLHSLCCSPLHDTVDLQSLVHTHTYAPNPNGSTTQNPCALLQSFLLLHPLGLCASQSRQRQQHGWVIKTT